MSQDLITTKQADTPQDFVIPVEFKDTMIYLTLKVELLKKGWKFQGIHEIYLKGKDIFPDNRKEPVDLKLDYAKNLNGKILGIRSRIDRVDNGGDLPPSKVKYTLMLEAGDTLISSSSATSNEKNPSEFFVSLKFQVS